MITVKTSLLCILLGMNARQEEILSLTAAERVTKLQQKDGDLTKRLKKFWSKHDTRNFVKLWNHLYVKVNEDNDARILINRMSRYISYHVLEMCYGQTHKGTDDKSLDPTRVLTDEEIYVLSHMTLKDYQLYKDLTVFDNKNKKHRGTLVLRAILQELPREFKNENIADLTRKVVKKHDELDKMLLKNIEIYLITIILTAVKEMKVPIITKEYSVTDDTPHIKVKNELEAYEAANVKIIQRYPVEEQNHHVKLDTIKIKQSGDEHIKDDEDNTIIESDDDVYQKELSYYNQ